MENIKMNKKEEIFNSICNFFNANNVMTIEDFNDICDDIEKEFLKGGND